MRADDTNAETGPPGGGPEPGHGDRVTLPGFVFDASRAELRSAGGERITLRPQVFAVLQCLARHAGELVRKDELLQTVWPGAAVTEDSLVQCIGELRRALKDDQHQIVQTQPRRGYRLVPAAAAASSDAGTPDASAEGAFHQEIRFATTPDGARLAYASSGSGAPLVRAAHWMTHLDWDWRSATLGPRIQALSRRHRLVRYDGRGYGLSDWGAEPGTLDDWVNDLEAVVDAAGLERFALLGASGGAPVSIRFAARHPERVTRLTLLGGFARGLLRRGGGAGVEQTFEAMLRLLEDGWAQDNSAFRQLMTSMFWPGASSAQMDSFNQLQRVSCTPQRAVSLLRRIAEFDATGDLPLVRCPTLVLHSPRDSRVIAASIPDARLEPFDSPNHTPLVDEPAFNHVQHAIDDFLLTAPAAATVRRQAVRTPLRIVEPSRRDKLKGTAGKSSRG
jgi:pimeloyl-ACP methyl ester carboxylesterase/DNA-binding winged helix-turn-helix (wHTH) protein